MLKHPITRRRFKRKVFKCKEYYTVMDQAHRKFVDSMYGRFGLTKHPGYCMIEVLPILSSAGFAPPHNIIINRSLISSVEDSIFHESAHFLHYNRRSRSYLQNGKKSLKEVSLNELVAYFGTMIYIYDCGGISEVERYIHEIGLGEEEDQPLFVARDLLTYPNILEAIANADFKEACQLIAPYTKRKFLTK